MLIYSAPRSVEKEYSSFLGRTPDEGSSSFQTTNLNNSNLSLHKCQNGNPIIPILTRLDGTSHVPNSPSPAFCELFREFRCLRTATKGSAFGIRKPLKRLDLNFNIITAYQSAHKSFPCLLSQHPTSAPYQACFLHHFRKEDSLCSWKQMMIPCHRCR